MKKTYHPYDETYARSQAWAKVARIAFVRDKIYAEPFSGSTPVNEIGSSMKYRLAFLKSINPQPPAGFVGKWRNVEGESWLRPAFLRHEWQPVWRLVRAAVITAVNRF